MKKLITIIAMLALTGLSLNATACTNPVFTLQPSTASYTVCENLFNDSLIVSATPANTYQWYMNTVASNTGGTLIAGATDSIYYPFNIGTYYYYCVAYDTSCSSVSNVSGAITVYPLPTVIASASSNPICPGQSTTLTGSGDSSSVYMWVIGMPTITVTPSTTTTYTVTGTSIDGCTATASITVVVSMGTPTITALANTICQGQSDTLHVYAAGAISYVWSTGSTSTWLGISPAVTTVYTVTAIGSGGCTSSASITINVNPNPVIAISSSPTTICQGTSVTLTATGAMTYIWCCGLGFFFPVVVTPTTTTTYTVTGTDNGCSASASVTVTVDPPLNIAVQAINASCSTCNDGSASVTVTGGTAPYMYMWDTSPVQYTQTAAGLLPGTYHICVTDANGCQGCLPVVVSYGNCSAAFSLVPDAFILHYYYAIDNSSGTPPLSYLWSWGDGTFDNIQYPSHTYSTAGSYNICLTITDATGCTNTYCDSSYLSKDVNSIIHVSVVQSLPTGMESYGSNSFSIYPIPATENITIENTSATNNTFLYIYTLQGQLLKQLSTNTETNNIDISSLAHGMYFVKLLSEKGIAVKRFVKE
jgi:hypothetical protein